MRKWHKFFLVETTADAVVAAVVADAAQAPDVETITTTVMEVAVAVQVAAAKCILIFSSFYVI